MVGIIGEEIWATWISFVSFISLDPEIFSKHLTPRANNSHCDVFHRCVKKGAVAEIKTTMLKPVIKLHRIGK